MRTLKGTFLGDILQAKKSGDALHRTFRQLAAERDALREQRLKLQQAIGAQHGMPVMPRRKLESHHGISSFFVGQRMMQRIHRQVANPKDGADGLGASLSDPSQMERFTRSHAVPIAASGASHEGLRAVAHSFYGEVPLVEVSKNRSSRAFDAAGRDPGQIRPSVTYDTKLARPTEFEVVRQWSQVLSAHIPRAYVQVEWIREPESWAVHSFDLDPERLPIFSAEWDEHLGREFDAAYARLSKDLADAGALANRTPHGIFAAEEPW